MSTTADLSAEDARRIAIASQGLAGWRPVASDPVDQVLEMLHGLAAVQLDTISVLARSHELVAYARLGPMDRAAIEEAYWGRGAAVEYWSHAACLLPVQAWPLFAFRRRHHVRRGCRWNDAPSTTTITEIRARLAAEGPLTVTDAGGARRAAGWWQWSDVKNALEWLLLVGDVVCTRRVGWRRVYDLPERALPSYDTGSWVDDDGIAGPSDDECLTSLVRIAGRVLGVGTVSDIADVHRLTHRDVNGRLREAGLTPVHVDGWSEPAWACPEALALLQRRARASSRTALLSPFDSLVWYRQRAERIFGMVHRLEAYTPAHQRVHGYFAMPVLHDGRLIARVDPKREGSTLVADTVTLETDGSGAITEESLRGTAEAIGQAARWVGATSIRVGRVTPTSVGEALRALLPVDADGTMKS